MAWSFWVNLVALRVLVFVLQEFLGARLGQDFRDSWVFVLLFAVSVHGVLFVWQAVGVIRAAEAHIRALGSIAPVWGAQIGLIVAVLWVGIHTHEAWRMAFPVPDRQGLQSEIEAERAAKYSIVPSGDGRSLILSGSLELGISGRLTEQLQAYPEVERIVLTSTGGNIYQARGLSKTIRENGLDTLVTSECSSACTTVFIGGSRRQMASGGKLGFHQYRIDANYAVLRANPLLEQERDRAIFLRSGVAAWFLDKMFDSGASGMWYPGVSELIDARVVTSVLP